MRNLIVLLVIGALVSPALSQTTVTTTSFSSANLGKVLGAVWKVCMLVCLVLMIADAWTRYNGRKLMNGQGVAHACRFLWFIYMTAVVWVISQNHGTLTNPYRDFLNDIFGNFYEQVYLGYFKSGFVGFFTNPTTLNGTAYSKDNLIQNSCFFEMAIFLVLRVAQLAMSGKINAGDRMANFIGTLRRIWGWFFGMYFFNHSMRFWQYLHDLRKTLHATPGSVAGRTEFNALLSWILALYIIIEVLWANIELFIAAYKSNLYVDKVRAPNYYPGNDNSAGIPLHRSYDGYIEEVAMMHLNKEVAHTSIFFRYYNAVYFFRTVGFIFVA